MAPAFPNSTALSKTSPVAIPVRSASSPAARAAGRDRLDATVRLIPKVLGNAVSTEEESHSSGLLEYPQYTRPAEWEGREIPAVGGIVRPGLLAELEGLA